MTNPDPEPLADAKEGPRQRPWLTQTRRCSPAMAMVTSPSVAPSPATAMASPDLSCRPGPMHLAACRGAVSGGVVSGHGVGRGHDHGHGYGRISGSGSGSISGHGHGQPGPGAVGPNSGQSVSTSSSSSTAATNSGRP